MDKNLNIIADELFGKIRTQFSKIKLGDAQSKVTDEPKLARFFEFDFEKDGVALGRVSVSLSDEDGLVIMYSNDIIADQPTTLKNKWFNFLRELREFAKQRMLNFATRDISKSNLDKRDYQQLAKQYGEGQMTESKLWGTNRTSFQDIGEAKIIVKHTQPVNYDLPAGRTMHIESIYIENADGERFKYPFKHLNGARAMARHVANGGTPYDKIGEHVISLSEELGQLRKFKGYVGRNEAISEAMGDITTKVMERIDSVKKEIYQLQNQSHYESFAESFTADERKEVPEDLLNDWIDRLTIRTFNEELKNAFPYIYRLVDETTLPIKELTADDLLGGETTEVEEEKATPVDTVEEFFQFESFLDRIVSEDNELFNAETQKSAVDTLNRLLSRDFPVGTDGTNAIESLQGIIDDEELNDIFKELADVNPESDAKNILKDYIKMKDDEMGTDLLSQLNFENQEGEFDGSPNATEPAAEPTTTATTEPAAEPAAQEQPVTASIEPTIEGNAFAQAVAKAKAAGMSPGDKFKVGEKEYTLKDAIEMAGMQVEDFFGDKQVSAQDELVEFVKSMYDNTTGNFPKGETGVLIAVEKKFGEGAIRIAEKIIEKLSSTVSENNIVSESNTVSYSEIQRIISLVNYR